MPGRVFAGCRGNAPARHAKVRRQVAGPSAAETLSRECARMKLKKRMILRKIFRAVGIGTALLAAAVALFIAVSWAVEYRPGERETTICCPEGEIVPLPDTLTILSWNIGYAGLGDNMDFFYDGGRRVRDSRERTARNLKEIVETISRVNPDIALLQEVDLDSRRSYRIREVDTLRAAFPGYTLAFAYNYKVCWVPVRRAPSGRCPGRSSSRTTWIRSAAGCILHRFP